jgi:CheY-specific phosphatase CheX
VTNSASFDVVEFNKRLAQIVNGAVNETFVVMTGMQPVVGQFQIVTRPSIVGDISGIINIATDEMEGAFILVFPKETVFHILARVYGKAFSDLNASVQDGVAEFTNVVYGLIKSGLFPMGIKLHVALPSVVIGDQHLILSPKTGPSLVFPVQIQNYTFNVIFSLSRIADKKK